MARSGMAGRGGGSQPTGEKHPRTALLSGEQAIHTAPPCDLCRLVRHSPSHPTLNNQLPTRLRVALVDGDERVHDFVRQAFEAHASGWTLDSHLTPHSALGALGAISATPFAQPPHVVLLEARLPVLSGIDCARRLTTRLPKARIVMFTACADNDTIVESLMVGAWGYLIKPVAPECLVWAVSEAAQGRPVLGGEAQAAAMDYIRRTGASDRCKTLSWREREVMLLLINGATTKDVARKLGIEEGTAHWHLDNIFKKLHVHSKDEARRKFAGGGVNSCSPGAD